MKVISFSFIWLVLFAGLLGQSATAAVLVGGSTLNGDFNAPGTAGAISFTAEGNWMALTANQTANFLNDTAANAYDGHYAQLSEQYVANPALDTGYTMGRGDVFDVSFLWRNGWQWTANDQVLVTLYTTDDDTATGVQTVLATVYSPTGPLIGTYTLVDQNAVYTAGAAQAGKTLFVGLQTQDGNGAANGYVQLDNFELEVTPLITQTVYVAASGNNANNGLTPGRAWQDVDALNGVPFGPGTQILFNRGDTFAGACTLTGSGATNNPIVIGTYGTGDKPLLTGAADQAAVFLLDSANEFIRFENLQLSNENTNNASVVERYGILVTPPHASGRVDCLHFIDLDFADIQGYDANYANRDDNHRSRAIYAETDGDDTDPTCFNDFLVDGCTFSNIDGQGVVLRDTSQDIADKKIRGTAYFPTTGFVFQNNYGTNIYRNLCMIWGPKDALIQHNIMDTTVEGSAFWPFGCEGTLVQYNLFMNIFAFDADAYVCHFDYNCVDTLMQYNIGINVEGGLIEYIDPSETWSFQEGGIARYNIGIDVGWRNKVNGAGIFLSGHAVGGQFYNNTIVQINSSMTYAISFQNWGGDWPTDNVLYNNIFDAGGANTVLFNQPLRAHPSSGLNNVVDNNLYYGNISPPQAWVVDHFEPVDLNAVTVDPLFVNPGGMTAADYKLLFGSGAISGGRLIADNGGLDYYGNAVASNALPTLGAHEYLYDPVIDSDGDKMPDQWEVGYALNPVDPADALIHSDSDNLLNLSEYAFGGNPQDGNDTGHPVSWSVSGSDMIYVYPRRTPSTLSYGLETSDNLVSNWVAGGYAEIGAGSLDAEFESVTNEVPMTGDAGFIRLGID